MARLNRSEHTISIKVVYYGPGLCGKTTNLKYLYGQYPDDVRGKLVQLDTETERTLFFDYFPTELPKVGEYRAKAEFFTVPGQSFYHATRKAVLTGADGMVFVADSSPDREEANAVSLADLRRNLASMGRPLEKLPLIFQWNKRDLPNALPLRVLERQLNPEGHPSIQAIASRGIGVWETHQLIMKAVVGQLETWASGVSGGLRARG